MVRHTIQQGECLTTLAEQYGLFWETIWSDGANASLRDKRRDPNVLYPGDVLTIPELRERKESGSTESKVRFRRLGIPPRFRLNVRVRTVDDEETPIANAAYRIEFDSGDTLEGSTDGDGLVEAPLPPRSRTANIFFESLHLTLPVSFGHLDPIDEIRGVQGRLNMLGFTCGPVDGIDGPLTKAAVRAFQQKNALTVDGIVGPETKGKLKEAFGS